MTTTLMTGLSGADAEVLRDGRIESLLRSWDVEFTFEPEFPLERIEDDREDSQVRAAEHRAPREMVQEYTTQMRAGAVFPPLVVTTGGWLVDGNTRLRAARALGRAHMPVYLVTLARADFGQMLGAGLNQTGGKRLSAEEAYRAAEKMMREGWADDAIARAIGRSPANVRNYRREHDFTEAAKRLGIDSLPIAKPNKRVLAGITHDAPLKEAAELVAKSQANQKEVSELVVAVQAARSEAEEIAAVDEFRGRWKVEGPPPRKAKPADRKAARARKILEELVSLGTPAELAVTARRQELEPVWVAVRDLADGVLAAFAGAGVQEQI